VPALLAHPAPRAATSPVDGSSGDAGWLAQAFAPEALGVRYQALRELGRGGMGLVMLARDRALHRTVALKLLHPHLALSPRALARFRREACLQAQLDHPAVVPVHDVGEVRLAGGARAAYFTMPYIAGESLAARMRREGVLPPAEVRRVLLALLDALAHAHAQGVVHRDLKPDNVLLARDGDRVLLTDFGVAARPSHDDPRYAQHDAGTPLYMAPEQFAGEHAIDGRTDLYAIGAVAYHMLAGRPPFVGASARALAVARFTGEAPPLGPLAPWAPAGLVAAVERCLAADPEARWPNARALHEAVAGRGWPVLAARWRRWSGRARAALAR
jgi:serine/threonine-protein kinase